MYWTYWSVIWFVGLLRGVPGVLDRRKIRQAWYGGVRIVSSRPRFDQHNLPQAWSLNVAKLLG